MCFISVSIVCACVCGSQLTGSVWLHGDCRSGVREQAESVSCCALLLEGVPLEINTMDVHLRT